MPQPYVSFTIQDYNGEKSNFKVYFEDIDETQLSTKGWDARNAQVGTLKTAVENLIAGNILSVDIVAPFFHDASPELPTNQQAQRETKWLVKFTDDTDGFWGNLEIPTADLTLLTARSGSLDTGLSEYAALNSALQTLDWCNRYGTSVSLRSIMHVGRNI